MIELCSSTFSCVVCQNKACSSASLALCYGLNNYVEHMLCARSCLRLYVQHTKQINVHGFVFSLTVQTVIGLTQCVRKISLLVWLQCLSAVTVNLQFSTFYPCPYFIITAPNLTTCSMPFYLWHQYRRSFALSLDGQPLLHVFCRFYADVLL